MRYIDPDALRESLVSGKDVLGETFVARHSARERRATGSTYTPMPIVSDMVSAAKRVVDPAVIVDCGCGSGRFALACAKVFPHAKVYAVDNSALACEMCQQNVSSLGLDEQVTVVEDDFTSFVPQRNDGQILWIGNPPYVRHHDVDQCHKSWLHSVAKELGVEVSLLSGLHVYFLVRIAQLWREGDSGILITSAEWLDTNYGQTMRDLLSNRLGLGSIELFDRHCRVFETADTTATIFSFGDGFAKPNGVVKARQHERPWHNLSVEELRKSNRWSNIILAETPERKDDDASLVPLGSLAAVHRGVVTGDNAFWVRNTYDLHDIPEGLKVPVVSHAREIMGDCPAQRNPDSLRRLVTLPQDLTTLTDDEAVAARKIISLAEEKGVQKGYIASHRKPWWSIVPPAPPAIMMTYMARHAPSFVVNTTGLTMLNVIHGIYPKQPMSPKAVSRLADYLNKMTKVSEGRMYSGGLVKFEPKEAESILVPPLSVLEA